MLTPDNAGADIQWDENGYSYILVDEPRMYGIVDNPPIPLPIGPHHALQLR